MTCMFMQAQINWEVECIVNKSSFIFLVQKVLHDFWSFLGSFFTILPYQCLISQVCAIITAKIGRNIYVFVIVWHIVRFYNSCFWLSIIVFKITKLITKYHCLGINYDTHFHKFVLLLALKMYGHLSLQDDMALIVYLITLLEPP